MTYIVAGKLNKSSFIMSDCIGTVADSDAPYKYLFVEKIKRLVSTPTLYYAIAGRGYVAQFVDFYDGWLHSQGQKIDFINDDTFLSKLINFIILSNQRVPQGPIALDKNRLFFVSHDDVFFCDINFDTSNNIIGKPSIVKLDNGKCVSSHIGYLDMQINIADNKSQDNDIRNFCLQVIDNIAFGDKQEKELLAKRIHFIILKEDGDDIIEPAFRLPSDVLAMAFEKSYQDLDNPNFAFSL